MLCVSSCLYRFPNTCSISSNFILSISIETNATKQRRQAVHEWICTFVCRFISLALRVLKFRLLFGGLRPPFDMVCFDILWGPNESR